MTVIFVALASSLMTKSLRSIREMSSMAFLSGAILVFAVVAILYYQSQNPIEHFLDVPADLNRAPNAKPISSLPKSKQMKQGTPGLERSPPEAMATQRELESLDDIISTWLTAASALEQSNPAALTPDQKQERVLLQARLTSVRNQIASGLIIDTFRAVQNDSKRIQSENNVWGKTSSQLDSVDGFAKSSPDDALLSDDQYRDFRGLVEAGYDEINGYLQPEPLQRVRLQQIQVVRMDLLTAERNGIPRIQVGNARLFLQNMLKADQPLPSLFQVPQTESFTNVDTNQTDDIRRDLRDLKWNLERQNDPSLSDAIESIGEILRRLQAGNASIDEIHTARAAIVEFQNTQSPGGFDGSPASPIQLRAQSICQKVRSAFPDDAEALGCPGDAKLVSKKQSQQIIHTVCDRIRYSVPSVSTEQFNCPAQNI